MNDFPMPEDPPVTMTAENGWSASRGEGTTEGGGVIAHRLQSRFSAAARNRSFTPPMTLMGANAHAGPRVTRMDAAGAGAIAWKASPQEFSGRALTRRNSNTTRSKGNMNSQNPHELIVSGIHLELTPSLKNFVREKSERLFRHGERIVRIRVELECDRSPTGGRQFKAKGHIAINGPDMNAAVVSEDCHKAVSLLTDKLDRMLSRRHQLLRVKRNHPHAVELEAALPKVG